MMKDAPSSTRVLRRFTVEQATAMLPLVRSIVSDICSVFRTVTGRRADLRRILRKGSLTSGQVYDDELAESRADLQEEYDLIWKYRQELETLGVILRHPENGHIEFPTLIMGRDAFLSWHVGEERIEHWRDAEASQSTRKLLSSLDNPN